MYVRKETAAFFSVNLQVKCLQFVNLTLNIQLGAVEKVISFSFQEQTPHLGTYQDFPKVTLCVQC